MNRHLVSETRKLTSLRLPRVVLGTSAVVSAVVGVANVETLAPGQHAALATVARAAAGPVWFLVTVVAVLAAAGEFQFHTFRTTVLANPRRGSALAAKAVVAAGYGLLATTVGLAVASVAGAVTASVRDVPMSAGTLGGWAGALGAILVGGLWGVLASALGVLTRSSALALTALLLWRFVGEGILPVVLRRPGIADWLPSGAATHLVDPGRGATTVLVSGLVVLGYTAAVCLAAAILLLRRDPA